MLEVLQASDILIGDKLVAAKSAKCFVASLTSRNPRCSELQKRSLCNLDGIGSDMPMDTK